MHESMGTSGVKLLDRKGSRRLVCRRSIERDVRHEEARRLLRLISILGERAVVGGQIVLTRGDSVRESER